MNELRMQTDCENLPSGEQLHRAPSLQDNAASSAATRAAAAVRHLRPRLTAARLRVPTDDGFHLFRIH
jgi:hypothetical protein